MGFVDGKRPPKINRTDFVLQIQFDSWITSPIVGKMNFYPTITSGHRGDGSKTTGTLAVVDSSYSLPLMNFHCRKPENYPVHPPYDVAICQQIVRRMKTLDSNGQSRNVFRFWL